jgi:hypothetical protein
LSDFDVFVHRRDLQRGVGGGTNAAPTFFYLKVIILATFEKEQIQKLGSE